MEQSRKQFYTRKTKYLKKVPHVEMEDIGNILSIDDLFNGKLLEELEKSKSNNTKTFNWKIPEETVTCLTIRTKIQYTSPNTKTKEVIEFLKENDKEKMYNVFQIPKSSGGLRTITAPNDALKEVQSTFAYFLATRNQLLAHNNAYAYTKGRSVQDMMRVHQANKSKWFLKIDLKDFFTNCTAELLRTQLGKIAQFQKEGDLLLDTTIDLATKGGCLPQGTPLSPLLSNLVMLPFDYRFTSYCCKHNLVYTRYADDMIISSEKSFDYKRVNAIIEQILKDEYYNLKVNDSKTRYGSSNGSNWNVGLMLNKDNNITIGYKNKKILKNMMYSLKKNTDAWTKEEVQVLNGKLEWLRSTEPQVYKNYIEWFTTKHNFDILRCIKDKLKEK